MELYTSYGVRIQGFPNITPCIADSWTMARTTLSNLKGLINEHRRTNQPEGTKKPTVVGLDVQCDSVKPSTAAILQLCFGTHCVIIQLFHMGFSIDFYLKFLFDDQGIIFVGVGIKNKLAKLGRGYECYKNMIDLGSLADRVCRRCKLFDFEVEELAREILGIEMKKPKSSNLANWSARDLTTEQIEYATITAYASYSIANKLLAKGGNN